MRRTMIRNIRKIAAAAALAVATAGCTQEVGIDNPTPGTGGETVRFTAAVPETHATTRALGAEQEAQVATVDVLVFSSGGTERLVEHVAVDAGIENNTNGPGAENAYSISFSAQLAKSDAARRIVLVANAPAGVRTALARMAVGTEREDVLEVLKMTLTGGWNTGTDYTRIPMYGETTGNIVPGGAITGMELVRMAARIDVTNSAAAKSDGFVLEKVHLANRNTVGNIWSEDGGLNVPANPGKLVGLGSGNANLLSYTVGAAEQKLAGEIYALEAAAAVDGATDAAASRLNAVCLLLEGTYNGVATWYRVDFTETDDVAERAVYLPLMRNTKYAVEITGVKAAGYDSAAEALASYTQPSNAKWRIHRETEGTMGVMVWDGQYYLGVEKDELNFDWIGETQYMKVKTNYAYNGETWKVEKITSGADVTSGTWDLLTFPYVVDGRLRVDPQVNVGAQVGGIPSRTVYVHLKAGRMRLTVKVNQGPGYYPGNPGSNSILLSGESNSYILPPAAPGEKLYYFMPIDRPYSTQIKTLTGVEPKIPLVGNMLWTDNAAGMADGGSAALIKGAWLGSLTENWLVVRPGRTEGNAVGTVMNFTSDANGLHTPGDPIWSYHIWTTNYNPGAGEAGRRNGANAVPGGNVYRDSGDTRPTVFMDRNLGALSATPGDPKTMGFLYQFGRKDPFAGGSSFSNNTLTPLYDSQGQPIQDANVSGQVTLAQGIANPSVFYYTANQDWVSDNPFRNTVWHDPSASVGSFQKSVFDPCPVGWRIPEGEDDGWGAVDNPASWGTFQNYGRFDSNSGYYPAAGERNQIAGLLVSVGTEASVWASVREYSTYGRRITINKDGVDISNHVTPFGHSVRCVAEEVLPWGGHADILYFDPDDEYRLKIGQWDDELNKDNYQQRMVFTKFGGVVGFTIEGSEDSPWNNNYVRFNPTAKTVEAYGSESNDAQNTLPNVPAYQSNLFSNYGPSVSDPVYHNYTNITQNGRGDICMLAGLTAEQIKEATTPEAFEALLAGRPAEYKGWRLPTARENASFVGGPSDSPNWRNWRNGSSSYAYFSTLNTTGSDTTWPYFYDNAGNLSTSSSAGVAGNPATGRFPVVTDAFNTAYSQKLPAVGYRWYNGKVSHPGTYGIYWSSTPLTNTGGYYIYMIPSAVRPVTNVIFAYGNSIRCVHPE